MIVVGLTGSIAMGKTEVAKIIAAEGIPVFDADREVHDLYNSKTGADLVARIAPAAVLGDAVDRKALSAILLKTPDLLPWLEQDVHREILERRQKFLARSANQGHDLAVLDIPLLFETGSDKDVDMIIVVSAPYHLQRSRALARPNMTEEKLDMILNRQTPDAEKRSRANYVIETTGTLDELRQRTHSILRQIRKQKPT